MVKLHEVIQSKDLLINILRNFEYCFLVSDKTGMHVTRMSAIGRSSTFFSADGDASQEGLTSTVDGSLLSIAGGPTVWYSDPLGRNADAGRFAGRTRQVIAAVNNDDGVGVDGPVMVGDRSYGGAGEADDHNTTALRGQS